jgi:dephospho-CoA kinase
MMIIGLSGTNGAGKDTVGHLLAAKHNLLFISVSDLLREEARKRGQEVTRETLRTISAEWRREFGLGVLVDKAVEHCESFGDKYDGVIACPMRNIGEAQHLKELGGTLLWIDADPKLRYNRIQLNAQHRNRKGEDDKTFEQFLEEERTEMEPAADGDEATLNMGGVKLLADKTVHNDGNNDLDDLLAHVDQALSLS